MALSVCVAGIAGCATIVTELSMDVVTDGQSFAIYFREVDRPDCTCNCGNFPAAGECVGNEDGIVCTCDPGPAHCLTTVAALRDGEVVTSEEVDTEMTWCGAVGGSAEVELDQLRIEGCGAVADIALDYVYSTPTIANVVETSPDTLQVEWTTTPPASFELVSRGSLSAVSCLDEDDGQAVVELFPYSPTHVSVRTIDRDEQVTPLGTARVWYGNEATFSWPAPE